MAKKQANTCKETADPTQVCYWSIREIMDDSESSRLTKHNPMLTCAIISLSTVKSHTEFPRTANAQYMPALVGVVMEARKSVHRCLRHR